MCAICLIENAIEIVKKFTKFFCVLTELVHANHTRAKPTKEQSQTLSNATKQDGPFVYRLGRKIFILERGVRFPHGLQVKRIKN